MKKTEFRNRGIKCLLSIVAATLWCASARPVEAGSSDGDNADAVQLRLSGVFSDHAVLQRGVPVPVWGWAKPGEPITVEFAGQTKETVTGADGRWHVPLDPMPASAESRALTVASPNHPTIQLSDLLVGDVWLCSGQSNMDLHLGYCARDYPLLKQKMESANNPLLRLGQVPFLIASEEQDDASCSWAEPTPSVANAYSAIGFLFGDQLQRELDIPVGIIRCARGGSYIEQWIPEMEIEALPAAEKYLRVYREFEADYPEAKAKYDADLANYNQRIAEGEKGLKAPKLPRGGPESWNAPSQLFNGMTAPIIPYAIKGVLWYQGEGNVWQFSNYDQMMIRLMNAWRERWNQPDLPFFMTELAPFGEYHEKPHDSARCRFGETLAKAAKADGNAWTITITDGGEQKDIHPRYKELPAERFTARVLAEVYGKEGISHGPVLKSWKVAGGKAVLLFDSVGVGLEARSITLDGHELSADTLTGFQIADKNRRFFAATAEIQGGNIIVLSHPEVPEPAAVRYAWSNFPLCNLYNASGFAAYPFRSDDWPWMTPPNK
jgi:sialate O-acetylesterase